MAKFSPLVALRTSTLLIATVASTALVFTAPLIAREPVSAQQSTTSAPRNASDWLYTGSDIPRDDVWKFGILPNGLRYAVRNNGVPPGQVAIRVRMDVGSLHERDDERGYAHLLEHLSFRGSAHIPDGEAKRIWQRFGVTFGSDSNAQTTPTQTVYKLDLPSFTDASFNESVKLLSGMVRAPGMSDASVTAERGVVMAELRENDGPQKRISDALSAHLFAGQLVADRSPIGTLQSLRSAQGKRVEEFHSRWYRPDRAVVVIAGDGDPAMFEQVIKQHFSDWKAEGPAPRDPNFGVLDQNAPQVKNIVEAGQPLGISLAMVRPWVKRVDTLENTYRLYFEYLAQAVVNRRLENLARTGGSFLVATASQEYLSRSADVTVVQAVPIADWKDALRDVRSVIEDARINAPTAQEIEREANEIAAFLRKEADNALNEPGARLADDLVRAVDINEVVTKPDVHVAIMEEVRKRATPQKILEISRAIYTGDVKRLAVTSPTPIEGGEAALQAALNEKVTARSDWQAEAAVNFAELPAIGPAGTLVSEAVVPGLRAKQWQFSNGVTAIVSDNMIEPGKVRVRVRFGSGYRSQSPIGQNLLWSGDYALVASGVGPWGLNNLDQAMNGRQIQMDFSIEDDAFELAGESSPADLADQLKLMAGKLAYPRWDEAPVQRLRVGMLTGYEMQRATPNAVLENDLRDWLSQQDKRFTAPTREEIEALTPEAFRKFWEPLLQSGPVEVQIFGDLSTVNAQQLVAETFGALPQRQIIMPFDGSRVGFPKAADRPMVTHHSGDANQAAAVVAWKTAGGQGLPRDARALEVLAAIFNDRLFDRLRAEQGASYGPIVESYWPSGFEGSGGYLMAGSLLTPKDVPAFYGIARDIAADLIAKPVSEDELARNVGPIREQVSRASTGNMFWMMLLRGASRDERIVRNAVMLEQDVNAVTAAEIQRVAKRYLSGKAPFSVAVLPDKMRFEDAASAGSPD